MLILYISKVINKNFQFLIHHNNHLYLIYKELIFLQQVIVVFLIYIQLQFLSLLHAIQHFQVYQFNSKFEFKLPLLIPY